MKILVTGAAGYIGEAFIHNILKNNRKATIVAMDIKEPNLEDYAQYKNLYRFIKTDLANETEMFATEVRNSNVVLHLAADVGVAAINDDPSGTFENSYKINTNILETMLGLRRPVPIVFASSSEVYGEGMDLKESDHISIPSPDNPRSGYAMNKAFMETMLFRSKLPFKIVRFFNVTGPGHRAMVIPKFIDLAKRGLAIPVYDNGSQVRSYCHVKEATDQLINVITKGEDRQIYNIGNSSNVSSVWQLAERIIAATGSQSVIEWVSFKNSLPNSHDIKMRTPDTSKVRSLGSSKDITLKDIIEEML